jgi:UDPglucose--hexose-1-phosphate uridylyltransferase
VRMDKTELRLDPLTKEWTVFNQARAFPPAVMEHVEMRPSPFTAGLERYVPHALYQEQGDYGWQVRVVPNRLPVLRVEGDHTPNGEDFYVHLDGVGAHEIVAEDPGTRSLEELPVVDVQRVVRAWKARLEDLMRDTRLRTFTIIKESGAAAGQTLQHSLSQVMAMAVIPSMLRTKLDSAHAYFVQHGRSLFADIIEQEFRRAARVVYENASFLVFCPYASRSPFEMAIWPRRQCADFHMITEEEVAHFADALRMSLQKLKQALGQPPYHLALTTAPSRATASTDWQQVENYFCWHVSIVPRLRPVSAFETATGSHINSVWPEAAAECLRQMEVQR